LAFEPNRGQTDTQVRYLARGAGYTLFLTDSEAVMVLAQAAPTGAGSRSATEPAAVPEMASVRLQLMGANPNAQSTGVQPLPGVSNYLLGNDPQQWVTDVPHYGQVQYQDVYPGINLEYYGNAHQQLEYDFVLAPGADPATIGVTFQGTTGIHLDAGGNLVLSTPVGDLTEQAPVLYQWINGVKQSVTGRYVLQGPSHIGFAVDG
jgi:hypothetical protein